jgi:hypothetical protein
MKITDAQQRALNTLKKRGDWMNLSDIRCRWSTINALVKKGLVEKKLVLVFPTAVFQRLYKIKTRED